MTSEYKFGNAHPVMAHLDREGMYWILGHLIGAKISEDRLKLYVDEIELMARWLRQEVDWFYNTFCNEISPMYRHKNNKG